MIALQALLTLWLALSCWRYSRRAAEANAALWQAMAALRMNHNALAEASTEAFADVGKTLTELEGGPQWGAIQPANRCNCNRCRVQRKLAVN